MDSSQLLFTQSRFYTPAFNAAIFDGLLKIYFAQMQEGQALHLYFYLQKQLENSSLAHFTKEEPQLLIMIYPNEESFQQACVEPQQIKKTTKTMMWSGSYADQKVLGLHGEMDEDFLQWINHQLEPLTASSFLKTTANEEVAELPI